MHWTKLVSSTKHFRDAYRGAELYDRYMANQDASRWLADREPDLPGAQLLINFINQWATRSPSKPEELLRGYLAVLPQLQLLAGLRFETLNLGAPVDHSNKTVASTIAEVFDGIARCGRRYESTGASKILHLLRPELFVMWDLRIAAGYGLCKDVERPRPNGTEYANIFLLRLTYESDNALESYSREKQVDRNQAVDDVLRLSGAPTFAKLLDEYNFMKFTAGVEDLWKLDPATELVGGAP